MNVTEKPMAQNRAHSGLALVRQQIKERVYQAAFVFLVLFAVMVIYNDLMKTLPGLMNRLP